jgi:hypothetical protein
MRPSGHQWFATQIFARFVQGILIVLISNKRPAQAGRLFVD